MANAAADLLQLGRPLATLRTMAGAAARACRDGVVTGREAVGEVSEHKELVDHITPPALKSPVSPNPRSQDSPQFSGGHITIPPENSTLTELSLDLHRAFTFSLWFRSIIAAKRSALMCRNPC